MAAPKGAGPKIDIFRPPIGSAREQVLQRDNPAEPRRRRRNHEMSARQVSSRSEAPTLAIAAL
jgi:hypothetical protein